MFEVSADYVKGYVRSGMTHVDVVIDCGTADVHLHGIGVYGLELLDLRA